MPTLNNLLIFNTQNEHVFEHDLSKKKNYSVPKIYSANGDIKKRGIYTFLTEILLLGIRQIDFYKWLQI